MSLKLYVFNIGILQYVSQLFQLLSALLSLKHNIKADYHNILIHRRLITSRSTNSHNIQVCLSGSIKVILSFHYFMSMRFIYFPQGHKRLKQKSSTYLHTSVF